MKLLKRLLCLLCVVPILGICVACKNDGDNNGGPQGPLSTSQIIKTASSKFLFACGNKSGDVGYCDGGEYAYEQYDEFLYVAARMMDAVANIQNVQQNVWLYGREGIISAKSSYANKVSKFKLSQTEAEGVVDIVIDMMLVVSNLPIAQNPESFDLWHYEIEYNRASQDVKVDFIIEKSRNYQDSGFAQNSRAKYIQVSFDSDKLMATSFERTANIYDVENGVLYNRDVIDNFTYLRFNFENKSVVEEDVLYPEGPARYALAKSVVLEAVALEQSFGLAVATVENFALTSAVLSLANADKIADIF